MAVNFIARKCACGGKLEFNPQRKIWICKYCGTVVEREATFDSVHVDGIEGINDIVRQTLTDIANNKLDNASRNLEDCERKNHKHVGTLIANISYNLSMISNAKSKEEAKSYLDKVKIYVKRFQQEFSVIAEDEINMYESFGEGVADLYANLLVVFDTLNDVGRIEFILTKLKAEEIFSQYANKQLLKIALKRNNLNIVETVVNNINHIDKKFSLQEIILKYPDVEQKKEILKKLSSRETIEAIPKEFYEKYFTESKDSIEVKTMIISQLSQTNLKCNAEVVLKAVYEQLSDYDISKDFFRALYEKKLNDQETENLLAFCLMSNKKYFVLEAFLDALIEKKIFIQLNSRSVISFLDSTELNINEKIEIIKQIFQFEIESKSKDAIYNYYLNLNKDSKEDRKCMIEVLLEKDCPISNHTVKNYIINNLEDEEYKIQIIDLIFNTGISKTYLADLLSDYILESKDEATIKNNIIEYLIAQGFRVDSDTLNQYIVSQIDSPEQMVDRVKKLVRNGTQIKADCFEKYVLSLNDGKNFSENMFNILTSGAFTISDHIYFKYLLQCKDADKGRHNSKLLNGISSNLNTSLLNFSHLGNRLTGNILQAYILTTEDHLELATAIVNELKVFNIKINSELKVNGELVKFKKYVGDRKGMLSTIAIQICDLNRMFSLF